MRVLRWFAVGAVALVVAGTALTGRAWGYVYWANFGAGGTGGGTTISRADFDGSNVDANFITGASAPTDVAVDSSHVYWGNYATDTIGVASLDGSGVNQSLIHTSSEPEAIAVDGSHIYWTNAGFPGSIGRSSLDGSGVNQDFITGTSNPEALTVDQSHVYWVNYDTNTIGRANLDGTGVNQTFISLAGTPDPLSLAVDRNHLYWADTSGTTLGRANLDGTAVNESFIAGATDPLAIAVNAEHVYWANDTIPGTLGEASLDGTGASQSFITQGTDGPWGIALGPLPATTTAAFGQSSLTLGSDTSLTFTLAEPDTGVDDTLAGVGLTNQLPAGLVLATPASATNTCGGTLTATADASSMKLSGGGLAPGASCTLTVHVHSTSAGMQTDVTGPVTSSDAEDAPGAQASVTVTEPAAPPVTPPMTTTPPPTTATTTSTTPPPRRRPEPTKITGISIRKRPLTWCAGCRYPSSRLYFRLNRATTLRLVLRAHVHGRWRQVAVSTLRAHRGANRFRVAGRWHGQMVPDRLVQILVELHVNARWTTHKTLTLTVRSPYTTRILNQTQAAIGTPAHALLVHP